MWGAGIDPKFERNLKKHPPKLITCSSFDVHSHHAIITAPFSNLFLLRKEEKQANERAEKELFTYCEGKDTKSMAQRGAAVSSL